MGNLPIGQGLSVTPMQMAAAYSAIAGDGVLRTPRLVLAQDGGPGRPAVPSERVISDGHAAKLREMLEGVLEAGGTASAVRSPATRSPARPAPRRRSSDGTYSETEFVASFVGFAPAEDPQLLVAVVVDNPKGDYYGGTVAAPAFGEIARYALPYLGIAPDGG